MGFFKKKDTSKESSDTTIKKTTTGFAGTYTTASEKMRLAKLYDKSNLTSNSIRDPSAMNAYKRKVFQQGAEIRDPLTNKKLYQTQDEAFMNHGNEWPYHAAETDHIESVNSILKKGKRHAFIKDDDLIEIANHDDNFQMLSKKTNVLKSDKSAEDFLSDLSEKGIDISDESSESFLKNSKKVAVRNSQKLRHGAIKNAFTEGHKAGLAGAKNAGIAGATASGILNIAALLKGEKTAKEALKDTAIDSGKAAATGYVFTGGLTTVSHALSNSSSKFVTALAKSNVPGHVITAVIVTGNTLKRYANGEITTQECIIELGEKGVNLASAGYAAAIGQTLIPIPVVGAVIGALVGTMASSAMYNHFIGSLQQRQLEHEERERLISEYQHFADEARRYRNELEEYLDAYFQDYRDCFDDALSTIMGAFKRGDTDGVIKGANQITRKLNGTVKYENMNEFKSFIFSGETDIL